MIELNEAVEPCCYPKCTAILRPGTELTCLAHKSWHDARVNAYGSGTPTEFSLWGTYDPTFWAEHHDIDPATGLPVTGEQQAKFAAAETERKQREFPPRNYTFRTDC